MDIKEIMKDLKEFSDEGATEYGYEMPLSEVRELIKALEKQIPLKPIETWDDGFVCPICNGFTTCQKWKNGYPYKAEFEYCPTCGQKLEQGVE